ncbi:SCO family protein [Azospirillum sp. TSO22-1]|uniref:SCO family protein n=1 Tax=Azospirillum sp. TSO22-1 TaxID=716789 RepID=UPI000D60D275|nr:SCO family protein [Azospirillum sp. TSO22-1]PWC40369.1 hypothetical protein TSO221_25265 [Azospirillum sp. TSO22-1]
MPHWFAALLALLMTAAPAWARLDGILVEPPAALPAFALEDHDGRPFTPAALAGRWTLVAVGYTSCPDVCPFTLANLEAVRAELATTTAPERLPRVVFLAVDPARDRPILRDYVHHFHPDFVGVTGGAEAVAVLLAGLDAKAVISPPDANGAYEVAHSAAVGVVAPDGRLVAKLSPPFDPAETAAFLTGLIRGLARGSAAP